MYPQGFFWQARRGVRSIRWYVCIPPTKDFSQKILDIVGVRRRRVCVLLPVSTFILHTQGARCNERYTRERDQHAVPCSDAVQAMPKQQVPTAEAALAQLLDLGGGEFPTKRA